MTQLSPAERHPRSFFLGSYTLSQTDLNSALLARTGLELAAVLQPPHFECWYHRPKAPVSLPQPPERWAFCLTGGHSIEQSSVSIRPITNILDPS